MVGGGTLQFDYSPHPALPNISNARLAKQPSRGPTARHAAEGLHEWAFRRPQVQILSPRPLFERKRPGTDRDPPQGLGLTHQEATEVLVDRLSNRTNLGDFRQQDELR